MGRGNIENTDKRNKITCAIRRREYPIVEGKKTNPLSVVTLRQSARGEEGGKQPPGKPPSRTDWRNQLISRRVCVRACDSRATTSEHPYGRRYSDMDIHIFAGKRARKRGRVRARKRERGRKKKIASQTRNDVISLTFSRTLPRFLASFRSTSEPADSWANGGCSAFLKPKANTRMARSSTTPTGIAYTYCECCNSRPTCSMTAAELRCTRGHDYRGLRYSGCDDNDEDDG